MIRFPASGNAFRYLGDDAPAPALSECDKKCGVEGAKAVGAHHFKLFLGSAVAVAAAVVIFDQVGTRKR